MNYNERQDIEMIGRVGKVMKWNGHASFRILSGLCTVFFYLFSLFVLNIYYGPQRPQQGTDFAAGPKSDAAHTTTTYPRETA
jgi:hypothetical protein